jgi:hypothetical protein
MGFEPPRPECAILIPVTNVAKNRGADVRGQIGAGTSRTKAVIELLAA